jgi:type I restriction enzyme S subunit
MSTLRPLRELVDNVSDAFTPSSASTRDYLLYSFEAHDSGKNPAAVAESEMKSGKKIVRSGDVLFAKLNPRIPRAWLVNAPDHGTPKVCSTEFVVLRPKDPAAFEPEYLSWMLLAPQFLAPIQAQVSSSTKSHQRVRPDFILDQGIPPRPRAEQQRTSRRIRDCLSRVDEMQRLREAALADATTLLDALVDEFVGGTDGNPARLGDVTSIASALVDPREPQYSSMRHIGGANIVSGTGELVDLKTAAEEKLISGKYVFTPHDVIYSKIRPKLRKVVRPDFTGLCSADSYPLRADPSRLTRDYLFYLLLSRQLTDYAVGGSNRAGIPKVNREHLLAFTFPLPPLIEQRRITKKLDSAWHTARALSDEITAVAPEETALRESILREAFAGNL